MSMAVTSPRRERTLFSLFLFYVMGPVFVVLSLVLFANHQRQTALTLIDESYLWNIASLEPIHASAPDANTMVLVLPRSDGTGSVRLSHSRGRWTALDASPRNHHLTDEALVGVGQKRLAELHSRLSTGSTS